MLALLVSEELIHGAGRDRLLGLLNGTRAPHWPNDADLQANDFLLEMIRCRQGCQLVVCRSGVFRWLDVGRSMEQGVYTIQAITPSGAKCIFDCFGLRLVSSCSRCQLQPIKVMIRSCHFRDNEQDILR